MSHPLGPWKFYKLDQAYTKRPDGKQFLRLIFVRRDGHPSKDYQVIYVWAKNTVVAVFHILRNGGMWNLGKFDNAVIEDK